MTAPPLQPRPATTGSLDLMLPLQPKLLPGYNLQSSYLSNTLSTVRPPDLPKNGKKEDYYKPNFDVIIEKRESITDSVKDNVISYSDVDRDNVNSEENDNHNIETDIIENIDSNDVINCNVIDVSADTSVDCHDDSPNNNSY